MTTGEIPWKKNRKAVLAVTGGIAAYKAPDILRALAKLGWDVEIALSEPASRFVSPLALGALSGKKVWTETDFLSPDRGPEIPHISLARWADVIIVAPATAASMARFAHGDASTLQGSLLLATRSPVVLFPAMNQAMWEHAATQANAKLCRELGYRVVEPDSGYLACGDEGRGRLPDTEIILEETFKALCPGKDLEGLQVLVTAGPTREHIDPVRFISNRSTGKMGTALARVAWYRGASVTVVAGGDVAPCYGSSFHHAETARDMFQLVMEQAPGKDIVVKAAAVGDYRPENVSDSKIKKEKHGSLSLKLTPNPDIAASLGEKKPQGTVLVGFAAETGDLKQNGLEKMRRKNLDLIAVNDISSTDSGFGTDTNRVHIMRNDGFSELVEGAKEFVADRIWSLAVELLSEKRK